MQEIEDNEIDRIGKIERVTIIRKKIKEKYRIYIKESCVKIKRKENNGLEVA